MRTISIVFKIIAVLIGLHALYAGCIQFEITAASSGDLWWDTGSAILFAFGLLLFCPNTFVSGSRVWRLAYTLLTVGWGLLVLSILVPKHDPAWCHPFTRREVVSAWVYALGAWSAALSLHFARRSRESNQQTQNIVANAPNSNL